MSFNKKWKEVKLKDITTDGKGHYGINASAVEYNDKLPTYLRITDITDDCRINKDGLKSVDEENADDYFLEKNDIVFARTGNSTGRAYLYKPEDGDFVYAGFLIKFNLDESKVNPKFIELYTMTEKYKNWVNAFATGSTRKNINATMYGNMKLNLPPRELQDFIVNTISPISSKIKVNNKLSNNLEKIAQTIYKSWFVDFEPFQDEEFVESRLGKIPKKWEVKKIKDISKVVLGKTPSTKKEDNYGDKYPFIRIPEMHDKMYIIDAEKKLSEIGHKSQEKKLIPENSIMVSCIGTVGLVSLNLNPSHTNQQINTITCDDELVEYLYFRMKNMRRKLIKIGSSGTTMGNINKGTFQKLKLIIPDKESLAEFHKIVKPLFDRIKFNLLENQSLKELRDSLLPKLMSGEIIVPLENAKEVN
jgi:type I restriction enzyme S subunit